jgi:hypothetical protein
LHAFTDVIGRRSVLFSAMACALIACREAATPAAPELPIVTDAAPIRTDRPRYVLEDGPFGPEATIMTTFKAPRDTPVYVANCNGAISVGLQRKSGNTWVPAWTTEMNGCASGPIEIPAEGERTESITIASRADAADEWRRTETRIETGTHRAVWYGVLTTFDPSTSRGDELPLEQRVSAPFEIENPVPRP